MIVQDYEKNKVSVIIPTYNYGRFLRDCISSVLNQSYENIEIIVVDDGSTDDTKDILKPYMDNITYIYQTNSGQSHARNKGISHSSGEYVLFLDADDLLHPESIEHRLNFLVSNPEIKIAVCKNRIFEEIDKNGLPASKRGWYLHTSNLDTHLFYLNIAPPHAFLSRREVILKTGLFDTGLTACEDYDYWVRAIYKGFIPYYCNKGLVYYRYHNESLSRNIYNEKYNNALITLRLNELINSNEPVFLKDTLGCRLAFTCGLLRDIYTLSKIYMKKDRYTIDLSNQMRRDINFDFKVIIEELESLIDPAFEKLFEDLKNNNKNYDLLTFESLYYILKLSNFLNFFGDDEDLKREKIAHCEREFQNRIFTDMSLNNDNFKILFTMLTTRHSPMKKLILLYEYIKAYSLGREVINYSLGLNTINKENFIMVCH